MGLPAAYVQLAVRLSPEVTRFDQVTPEAVVAAALELGLPKSLALRASREVVTRVLDAFDTVYAEHYPQEERLLAQLRANGVKPAAGLDDFLEGKEAEQATQAASAEPHATHVTPQEKAQQLKILRVLRHMVLPEMVRRILR